MTPPSDPKAEPSPETIERIGNLIERIDDQSNLCKHQIAQRNPQTIRSTLFSIQKLARAALDAIGWDHYADTRKDTAAPTCADRKAALATVNHVLDGCVGGEYKMPDHAQAGINITVGELKAIRAALMQGDAPSSSSAIDTPEKAIAILKQQADTLAAALEKFVLAFDEGEKMLAPKNDKNQMEYISAAIKLAEYRLCYADFTKARAALEAHRGKK